DVCSLATSPHPQAITIEIIRGLGRLHGETLIVAAATALVDWCDRHLGGLEEVGNPTNPPLTACDPVLLQTIAYSLGNLGQPIGRSWLDRFALDPRDRVRITASVAIQKLNITPHDTTYDTPGD
ncbi:MAG: hypothetical protein EAZ61_07345, partial [Oscillatoriales cyanobacterium]